METKQMLCTINYHFKGRFWFEPLKALAEKSFMKIRSRWVKMVNPLYEEVNALWDIKHPELRGVKLEGDILDEYDRYVSKMINHRVLSIYGGYPGDLLFKGLSNPETADFRLVCRFNKHMFVDYDITIINED